MRPSLRYSCNEKLDEVVVLPAAHPLVAPADIEWVVKTIRIVRADVDHDWQDRRWMEAAAARIRREFADWDAHAAASLIAQTQNALAIGHHDGLDVVEAGMSEDLREAVLVRQTQEQSAWLSE
jgi:hypothetical protein